MVDCPYLAMTAAEIHRTDPLPDNLAYMACHFSAYGTGLCNLPASLPEGAMLILNDRTPIYGHDPALIASQLCKAVADLRCSSVLLDLQRPDVPQTHALVRAVIGSMPCPVGVSHIYAGELDCPVFLPPVPLTCTADAHLAPWQGREIWLEAALDAECVRITESGSQATPLPYATPPEDVFTDDLLHCSYHTTLHEDCVQFHLYRTREQLDALLAHAQALGVKTAVGLYQQLG